MACGKTLGMGETCSVGHECADCLYKATVSRYFSRIRKAIVEKDNALALKLVDDLKKKLVKILGF